ncbi:MAG: histidine kinase, partial [Terriglobia bacterium]
AITHDLLKTGPAELLEEQQRKLLAEGRWEGELCHVTREGANLTVASRQRLRRGSEGQPLTVLEINRDITERKRNERLLREEHEANRQLSGRLLRMQDEERRRIARELHDSTAQTLSVLSINLALMQMSHAVKTDSQLAKTVAESEALAKLAADEVRNISHLLHPPDLDNIGLTAAIRWYAARFAERSGISVDIDLPSHLDRMPGDLETGLFRVVQESLTNIQRHSGSKVAAIRLLHDKDQVILEVEDHGCGMPPRLFERNEESVLQLGVGVAGMQERLRQLGGRLEFISTGGGTTVRAAAPVVARDVRNASAAS